MTQFGRSEFSVPRGGREPSSCDHGWVVKGVCVFCGARPCEHEETVHDKEMDVVLCVACGTIVG